jgi:hypothetical protein
MNLRRTAVLALAVTSIGLVLMPPALAARVLKPAAALSSPLAWTDGNTLARSQGYLQTAWATDCPPPSGRCATDRGPHVGVFWQRALRAKPGTWSKPRRVSLPRQQAARPAVAASGSNVYVAWVTQTSYLHYRPKAPRILWIRTSRNQGATWGAAVQLSTPGSRADFPVIAASGNRAWVVWTGSGSGSILMASTTNKGVHWTTQTIGTTLAGRGSPEGYQGFPAIGASGANVMAAWFVGPAGKQVAVVSNANGSDWTTPPTPIALTPQSPDDGVHYPVVRGADDGASTHVAVAYATATGIQTRTYDGSSLSAPTVVAGPWSATSTYTGGYGAAAIPFGTNDVAVAWSGCRRVKALTHSCRPTMKKARIDLLERESTNGGATWTRIFRISVATPAVPVNEAPSLEADGANGHRSFVWLRRTANWINYRVWIRNGSVTD